MNQFTPADLEQLKSKGISEAAVEQQLARFRTGFPYLRIESPSAPGAGMLSIDKDLAEAGASRWEMFLQDGGRGSSGARYPGSSACGAHT